MIKMRRVVISGVGGVTGLGSMGQTFAGFIEGRSCLRRLSEAMPESPLCGSYGRLFVGAAGPMDRSGLTSGGRASDMATKALDEALESAGLSLKDLSHRADTTGLAMGALASDLGYVASEVERGVKDRLFMFRSLGNALAGSLAARMGLRGPSIVSGTSCAASLCALGEALHVLRRGEANLMLVGGAEAPLHSTFLRGATRLGVADVCGSTAFDKRRAGLAASEGAAFLVVEELESCLARGGQQKILAELLGFGCTTDGANLLAPPADGRGGFAAMARAAADAGITKRAMSGDLAFNCHATGTQAGDASELRAVLAFVRLVESEINFADARFDPSTTLEKLNNVSVSGKYTLSAPKANIGHLFSAAGAIETGLACLSMAKGVLPPISNLEQPDIEADSPLILPTKPLSFHPQFLMKNSFGFGGINAAVLLKRFEH